MSEIRATRIIGISLIKPIQISTLAASDDVGLGLGYGEASHLRRAYNKPLSRNRPNAATVVASLISPSRIIRSTSDSANSPIGSAIASSFFAESDNKLAPEMVSQHTKA